MPYFHSFSPLSSIPKPHKFKTTYENYWSIGIKTPISSKSLGWSRIRNTISIDPCQTVCQHNEIVGIEHSIICNGNNPPCPTTPNIIHFTFHASPLLHSQNPVMNVNGGAIGLTITVALAGLATTLIWRTLMKDQVANMNRMHQG